jgi:hypothetical protein
MATNTVGTELKLKIMLLYAVYDDTLFGMWLQYQLMKNLNP